MAEPPKGPIRGLQDVVVSDTSICFIDGIKGRLIYRGYDIRDLARHSNFEETTFLLFHSRLPRKSELDEFRHKLSSYYAVPPEMIQMIRTLPRSAHPMDVLRTAVSALATFDPQTEDNSPVANLEKATRLAGRISTIVALYDRIRNGQEPVPPDMRQGIAWNFLYMRSGRAPDDFSARVLDVMLILHADHELNASTFSARVTGSTGADLYAAITSAIGTLKGPLHGGANQKVMEMLMSINNVQRAESWVKDALAQKKKIMGFGHRVYKTEDPRATILREFARELGQRHNQMHWYEITRRVEELMATRDKPLYPNVDLYSASCYEMLGIAPDLNTCMFAMGRISGWCSHLIEQTLDNKLIRPLGDYKGPLDLAYVPIDRR